MRQKSRRTDCPLIPLRRRTLGCLEAVAEREGDHPPITLRILRITCYELGLDGVLGGVQEVLHPESKGEGTEAIVSLERE